MALRDFFLGQQTNQILPSRLPGTAKGWDTSSVNREVRIDPSVNSDVEILPSMAVKLSGRAGQSLYVVPCAAKTDIPFGFVIYKAKSLNQNRTINRMMTVGRSMQLMDFVFKGAITAGQSVYQDPTDGYCTGDSDDGFYVGTAMETVQSTATFPVIATVEINIRTVTSGTAESATDVSFNPTGLKVLTSQNVQGALGQTDSALADLQDSASILQTTVTLANTIGADTVVMLDELTAFEIDGRPNYKEPGATVYGPNGAQGIIHTVDADNQSATIKTTVLATVAGSGTDNNGLEGDYCARYGIDDETKSGLPYQGTGNQVIVPAQLQMDVPGVAGLTTNASQIVHDLIATTNCELFLAQGTVIEATDVFFQITEPQDGTTGYAAWWNGTEWKFKSNDTGNVWRAANAVRIAKCIFTGGNLTRLCFTGCRVLNKQEYATARALKLSDTFAQSVANNATYNVLTTFDLSTDTILEANTSASNFSLTSGVLKVPASPKYSDYTIIIRLSGAMDGGEGTSREFGVQLQRADGTVVAENAVVKVSGNDLSKRAITFATYTKGTTDPFSVGGLKLVINNTSGRALNLTGAEILIKMIA